MTLTKNQKIGVVVVIVIIAIWFIFFRPRKVVAPVAAPAKKPGESGFGGLYTKKSCLPCIQSAQELMKATCKDPEPVCLQKFVDLIKKCGCNSCVDKFISDIKPCETDPQGGDCVKLKFQMLYACANGTGPSTK